jgi:hypothetical protein
MAVDAAAGYELAYGEARRALDDQERAVTELRSRAGALIAAAAITTSFFGGQVLARGGAGVSAAVVAACVSALALGVAAVWAVAERRWLLAVAGVALALAAWLLGEAALADAGESRSAAMAVASFVALGLAVLVVLWPRHDWEFAMDPQWFIANYLEPEAGEPLAVSAIHRDIALHMGASARKNRRQLRPVDGGLPRGCVALGRRGAGVGCCSGQRVVDSVAMADAPKPPPEPVRPSPMVGETRDGSRPSPPAGGKRL